jgi:hypothetical protein
MPDSYDSWRTAEPDRLAPADADSREDDDMAQVALLETFAVTVPGRPNEVFRGELLSTYRHGGRRIRVVASGGMVVYDTDDCYDIGNARNALENWLAEQEAAARPVGVSHGDPDSTGGGPVG